MPTTMPVKAFPRRLNQEEPEVTWMESGIMI
jgi:hypothetical protein